MRYIRSAIISLGLMLAAFLPVMAQEGPLSPLAVLKADGAKLEFQVETAADFDSRAQGLMYRESLAPDHGMLFVFEEPQRAQFWMRNTLIPLDMIFIKADGHVANIIANAEPHTDTPRPSKGRVIAVLELKGGRAAELGIKPGDLVQHNLLGGSN